MTEHDKRKANAAAQARHRVGTAGRLKAIESKLEDLQHDVREVLTSVHITKSLYQDNRDA